MTIAINWSLAKCSCPSWSAITDESALRSALAGLDASNSSLYWWLGFWTTLVAVGVALEVVFVVWEYLEELHDFRRGFIHAPERPPTLLFVMGLLGAGLVAAGVSGELWEESKIGTVETCIRKGNDALSSLLSKEAAKAQESARLAKLEADGATASAKEANDAAKAAQEKADAVAEQAKNLDRDLVTAKTQLEAVETKRAELEKSLTNLAVCNAPRILQTWTMGQGTDRTKDKSSTDPLKPFADTHVVLEYEQFDAETRRAALQLATSLASAGWIIDKAIPLVGLRDGVEVQHFVSDGYDQQMAEGRANDVADALVDFLHSNNWEAQFGWPVDDKGVLIRGTKIVPLAGLRIRVGMYPAVMFVAPPGAQAIATASAEENKYIEQKRKEDEEQQEKHHAEVLKTLSPQEAIRYKVLIEESRKRERRFRERYHSSPCQPLSSIFRLFHNPVDAKRHHYLTPCVIAVV